MHSTLLIAVLAGLGGMIGWGAADFFAKKTIDRIGDLRTLFWAQMIGIAPLLVLFAANPHIPHLQRYDLLFLILLRAVSALSYLPLYAGFGKGEVSLLSPIFASYSVVVVILAAIFLDTQLNASSGIAILLVFLGILLLSTDPREIRQMVKARSNPVKGVPEVLLAMLSYSFWLLFLDKFLNGKEWVFYLLIIRLMATITLFVYGSVTSQKLSFKQSGLWKPLVIIGCFDVLAFGAVSYGFSHTSHIEIVTVLSATFSLPTIVLAYIFLKERITRLQAFASAFVICGIVLISLG